MAKQPEEQLESWMDALLDHPETRAAKARLERRTTGNHTETFFVPLTPSLRAHLNLPSSLSSIPLRWIKGDTPAHTDRGAHPFSETHLIYLTDSPGNLLLDGTPYPIRKGNSYCFSEGISHQTTGTGSEPRLLLGPMSEQGIPVGASGIYAPGGTTVYLRQLAVGSDVEYSVDQVDWYTVYWYCLLSNTDTSLGTLTIELLTDITLDSTVGGSYGYFVCVSDKIQIGSTSLKGDGTRPVLTIDGITNYPGLINNGSSGSNGYQHITIVNLEVNATGGSTLDPGAGWLGQSYFASATPSSDNLILNCHSTGPVSTNGGGIIGAYAGPVKVIGCSSSGTVDQDGGGIVGSDSPTSGLLRCESCWSTGSIGTFGGGITGSMTGTATIVTCYSEGAILENAGGISGRYTGGPGNTVVTGCYSKGAISDRGGGIVGSDTGTLTISNSYATGTIAVGAGGILGTIPGGNSTPKTITTCYTTGASGTANGYIIAGRTEETGTFTIGSGVITLVTNYSEANHSGTGWSNTNATSTLQGTPSPILGTTWVSAGTNQPYELREMGYTPYTVANVTGSPLSLQRIYSASVEAGTATPPALIPGKSYTFLEKTGGDSGSYSSITLHGTTGVISTTAQTAPGTYTLYLRHTGSYNITSYLLTITNPSSSSSSVIAPCCEANPSCLQPQTSNYDASVSLGRHSSKAVLAGVDAFYGGVVSGQRTAHSQPVFKSYHDYILFLQGKLR